MTLMKNGQIIYSGSPASYGFYGSLNDMENNPVLTVTMCNEGGCGEDEVEVYRPAWHSHAEGAVSAQWQDIIPDPWDTIIDVGYESYTRVLDADFLLADYSVETVGTRNGRVKHVHTADALTWEDGKRTPDWHAYYQITASWDTPLKATAERTAGCYVWTTWLPNQSPLCTDMNEFGNPNTPGSAIIDWATAQGSLSANGFAVEGDTQLDVSP